MDKLLRMHPLNVILALFEKWNLLFLIPTGIMSFIIPAATVVEAHPLAPYVMLAGSLTLWFMTLQKKWADNRKAIAEAKIEEQKLIQLQLDNERSRRLAEDENEDKEDKEEN